MGRKKQNPEESVKRGLILKVAGKMFMTQGYSSVSMDSLAQTVPVSKPTLYKHFRDKKALFSAVMLSRCQQVFDRLEQILQEEKDVRQALTKVARHFIDLVYEQEALNIYRVAITESRTFPDLGKSMYESGPKRSMAVVQEYLEKMHKQGVLRVADPELAANMFLSMLTNRIHMKCLLGLKKKLTVQEKNAIASYAVEIFLNGQRA